MKKQTVLNLVTLALPLAVVAIAVTPNSGMVINGTEAPTYTTFAEAVVGSPVGWCAPVALLLSYAMFGLAVLNMVVKKPLWMKLIRGASFVAACLAACPILINTQVRVIPSVFAAIVLMVLWGLSHYMVTHPEKQKEEKPKGRRLAGK